MKPQFIPDLQDWSGSFAGSASIVTDTNFAWTWSDGAQEVAVQEVAAHDIAAAAGVQADMSLLSPDIDAGILQATGNGDAMALGLVEISDGNLSLPVSDAAPIASEDGSAAPATMSFATVVAGSASSGSVPGALASPTIVPVAAHALDAGPGYSDSIAAVAHPDAQIFFTGLPTALPVNGGAPAALSVALETAHAAPDLSAGAVLVNPAEVSQNPITDASIGAHGATAAQVQQALDESGLSVNGSGIKVGVLSDSFDDLGGAATDESDGALPSAANVQDLADMSSGGTDEGRAMMQIVHDIAPNASLAFYTADGGEQAFANGILALAAAGCKVICDDVSYLDEPFFGSGVIAQAIQTVEAEGVTYITSAGNNASNAYQAAWTPTSGWFDGLFFTDAQNFGGSLAETVTVTASSANPVSLLLEWNDAYGQANFNSGQAPDIDMFIFHNGSLIGQATNATVGEANNPFTGCDLTASGTYQIVISNNFGPDPGVIKLIAAGDGLPVTLSDANAGTVFGHALTTGVITVGAVSTADTPAFGFSTPVSETFSSSGAGSELLYNADGTALSSPLMINPVAVSSVDNIFTTVTGGLSDFYGTSAASASLAGVAALILAANPSLTPAQVEQVMEETALPMSNAAVSGAGLVQVNAAVAAAEAFASMVVESVGSISLVETNGDFYLDSISSGSGPQLKYGGNVFASEFGAWTFIGAEQITGGYEVALHLPGSDQYTVWDTDSTGNVVSNGVGGIVSGTSSALESLEASFHQDLNGDGTIGVTTSTIESFGSTSLVAVGDNFYLNGTGGGSGPEFAYGGTPVTADEFGVWTFIGAEQITGGYEVALHLPGSDQYTVWDTDSTGNVISNAVGGIVSGTNGTLELLEASFHQDLNGDGVIGINGTAIESFGSTSLVAIEDNFYLNSTGGGLGPEFAYGGAPVSADEFGAWTFIGAEQITGGYEVALHLPGTDQYTVWDTDNTGNVVSNAVGGVVSGTNGALESLETSFHQDLNGDGVIGIHGTTIESFGSTSLVAVGGNFYLNGTGGGSGPEFAYGGAPVTADEFGAWTFIGAEQITGGYEVALHLPGSDQYTVWDTDSTGNVVSNAVGGIVSGTSNALESLEASFHQDLNGDGTIGVVSQNSSVISMAVATAAGSTGHDNFVFHPALGQQAPANLGPSATIAPEEVAHFTNGNQVAGFWSDNHTGNIQTSPQPVHDGQGETADAGNHDLANALSVHHAEFMHAYLIH